MPKKRSFYSGTILEVIQREKKEEMIRAGRVITIKTIAYPSKTVTLRIETKLVKPKTPH